MKVFPLRSDRLTLGVTETGGHLSDVRFTLPGGREVAPMHVAPWADEELPPETPPILRVLRGDFFCAPFGASDLVPEETRVHGLPANGTWRLLEAGDSAIDAVLDGQVMGASVTKHVEVRSGETIVYQRHTLAGGRGRLPVGYHAMLRADSPLQLGFSRWTMALSMPKPEEEPPLGRALLASNQTIGDLRRAKRADGGEVDLTVFPSPERYESIWMLVADRTPPFAWTAATSADQGWVWFSLKDPRVLPETLLWLSNGGRDYPPWNGRHRRVIGLEEICGYFHLGHAASTGDNPLAAKGIPTAADLTPERPLIVSYLFGLAAIPPGFGAVADIAEVTDGVNLIDAGGRKVFAACDVSFLRNSAA
jgi:hypothetical protein